MGDVLFELATSPTDVADDDFLDFRFRGFGADALAWMFSEWASHGKPSVLGIVIISAATESSIAAATASAISSC